MTKNILPFLMAAALSGCAGVSITPITKTEASNAHNAATNIKGYIVYAPVTVVEVSDKVLCLKPAKDTCEKWQVICGFGTPFVVPDYSKPFVVQINAGFGKAGVDIGLKDGWLMTHIKDTSDNAAVLGFIEKLVLAETKKSLQKQEETATTGCSIAGLYRVDSDAAGVQLKRLKVK